MLTRLQHLILIAVFAAVQVLGQASSLLVRTSGDCGVGLAEAGCCCSGPETGEVVGALVSSDRSCCSGVDDGGLSGERSTSEDSETYESGCQCAETPSAPLPAAPYSSPDGAAGYRCAGASATPSWERTDPTESSVWPNERWGNSRSPDPPPLADEKATCAFTQAFLI